MENQQKTGAFKYRGASYKLMNLSEDALRRGVVTASAGNHAQGVALAAKNLGVEATIFMPSHTPYQKILATKNYGANVNLVGEHFDDALFESLKFKASTGATYIHPFDDYDVMAGQGTVGIELLHQVPHLDTIIVPIGGGGLIAGIAVAAKSINPNIKVIGVEPFGACAMYDTYYSHQHITLKNPQTIADGTCVKEAGNLTETVVRQYVDEIVLVSESEIANGMIFLLERTKTLVEGAGALSIAYVLNKHELIQGKNIGVIVSGGNTDISKLNDIYKLSRKKEPVY